MPKNKTNFHFYYEKIAQDPSCQLALERAEYELDISMKMYSLRKKWGLTQEQIGVVLGWTQPVVSRFETGDFTGYSLAGLKKIMARLSFY